MTKLKNGASGPGIAANYIIGKYGKHMTQQQKVQLINSFKGYVSANAQYNKMIQAAGSDAENECPPAVRPVLSSWSGEPECH